MGMNMVAFRQANSEEVRIIIEAGDFLDPDSEPLFASGAVELWLAEQGGNAYGLCILYRQHEEALVADGSKRACVNLQGLSDEFIDMYFDELLIRRVFRRARELGFQEVTALIPADDKNEEDYLQLFGFEATPYTFRNSIHLIEPSFLSSAGLKLLLAPLNAEDDD